MTPLINILVRTHRANKFKACQRSINQCGYDNIMVHVFDGTGHNMGFKYNLICNTLKADMNDGYFFFLDDDDTIIPGALTKIAEHLTDTTPVICQMLRGGRPKPAYNAIERGRIGLPCMVLHHSHKHVADVTARESGDYDWIKAVTDKLGYKWVEVPLVDSPKRSYGI